MAIFLFTNSSKFYLNEKGELPLVRGKDYEKVLEPRYEISRNHAPIGIAKREIYIKVGIRNPRIYKVLDESGNCYLVERLFTNAPGDE